jgi:DnaJ-domain-containing protein 1
MAAPDISAWRRQNSDVVTVDLVLIDSTIMKGRILQPRDKTLRDLMNDANNQYLEFECFQLGHLVLAKSQVRTIRKNEMPRADQLETRERAIEQSDPFVILGVQKSSSRETIRQAYINLARRYHPDRFAGSDLPGEVAEYLNAMARRINLAYAELSALLGGELAAPPPNDVR